MKGRSFAPWIYGDKTPVYLLWQRMGSGHCPGRGSYRRQAQPGQKVSSVSM